MGNATAHALRINRPPPPFPAHKPSPCSSYQPPSPPIPAHTPSPCSSFHPPPPLPTHPPHAEGKLKAVQDRVALAHAIASLAGSPAAGAADVATVVLDFLCGQYKVGTAVSAWGGWGLLSVGRVGWGGMGRAWCPASKD
jgi:hypothetical protein